MSLLALVLAYAGWLSLCLAMPRHQRPLLQRELGTTSGRLLRAAGAALLVAGFAAAVAALGWQIGPVAWIACLAVSGIALVLALPLAPRACLRAAAVLPPLALLVLLIR